MKPPQRKWLIASLEAILLPELERRGFQRAPLAGEDARGEMAIGFPFGRMRRETAAGLELVEIQLDKRRLPAFRLNLGIAPEGGIQHPLTGHVPQDEIWVHYLPRYWEVYASRWTSHGLPFTRRWFAARRWPGAVPARADYDALVQRVVMLLPHVERALREQAPGPHVREVDAW